MIKGHSTKQYLSTDLSIQVEEFEDFELKNMNESDSVELVLCTKEVALLFSLDSMPYNRFDLRFKHCSIFAKA
jgi:hypothetical protein